MVMDTVLDWEDAIKNNIIAKDSTGNPLTYEFYFGNTGLIDVFDERHENGFGPSMIH